MISHEPGLAGDVDELRNRIQDNAIPLTSAQTCGGVPGSNVPNNTFGHGRINAVQTILDEFFEQGFESVTQP